MITVENYLQVVDPQRLLVVELADSRSLVVLSIGYVPAMDATGARCVALELVYDPAVGAPSVPYTCPVERLRRELVPPGSVRKVRPYAPS